MFASFFSQWKVGGFQILVLFVETNDLRIFGDWLPPKVALKKNMEWKNLTLEELARWVQMSNEKRAPGCLGFIGDEVLPSYMGIIIKPV